MTDQLSQIVVTTQELTAQIGALVKGDETIAEVQQVLGAMWEAAEQAQDQAQLEIIGFAWEKAQTLAQIANTAVDTAQVAVEVITAIEAQRDALVKSAEELMEAVESADMAHPVVRNMYEIVHDDFMDSMDGYYSYCPACDMTANHTHERTGTQLVHDVAEQFFDVLMGDPDESLTDDLAKELVDFIVQFVRKVADSQNAQAS